MTPNTQLMTDLAHRLDELNIQPQLLAALQTCEYWTPFKQGKVVLFIDDSGRIPSGLVHTEMVGKLLSKF